MNVTVDDTTWRAARIYAAEHDTSVSALVRAALQSVVAKGERSQKVKSQKEREKLAHLFESVSFELGEMPDRESLHER